MKIDELPRKAVLGYLELTRVPLTAAERVLGKTEGTWPVTIAADRLQARVKEVAGTVLRDDELLANARLQNAALDERLRALDAEAEAERIRREADARLAADTRAANEAKREVERREELRERQVDKTVQAKKTQVRKQVAKQEQMLEQREDAVTRDLLAKEAKAVNEQRAAAEAKAEVLDLEDKLNATKAARKRS
jgi:hypothetical protein